jgi:hypothetical protein
MVAWNKVLCHGHCYNGDGGNNRCVERDPETGVRCSLDKLHLDKEYGNHESRHIHCKNHPQGNFDLKYHASTIWTYDKKRIYLKKTRSPRSIRGF